MDNSVENFDVKFGNCFGNDGMYSYLNIDFIEKMVKEIPDDEDLKTTDHLIDEVFGFITNEIAQIEDTSFRNFQSEEELLNENSLSADSNELFSVSPTQPHYTSDTNIAAIDEYFNGIRADHSYKISDMVRSIPLVYMPGQVMLLEHCYAYSQSVGEPAESYIIIPPSQAYYQTEEITKVKSERSIKIVSSAAKFAKFQQERQTNNQVHRATSLGGVFEVSNNNNDRFSTCNPPTTYGMMSNSYEAAEIHNTNDNSESYSKIRKFKWPTESLQSNILKNHSTNQHSKCIPSANKRKRSTVNTNGPNAKMIITQPKVIPDHHIDLAKKSTVYRNKQLNPNHRLLAREQSNIQISKITRHKNII